MATGQQKCLRRPAVTICVASPASEACRVSTFLKFEPLEELIDMRYGKWVDGSPFAVPLKMEHLTAIARKGKRTLPLNRKRDSRLFVQFPGLVRQQELVGLHQRVSRTIKAQTTTLSGPQLRSSHSLLAGKPYTLYEELVRQQLD
jgi:hypothetical protein